MFEMQHGSVAIVAGGARGIGRACALRLAELGVRVAVLDIQLDGAAEFGEELTAPSVAEELQNRAGEGMALQVDLSNVGATGAATDAVVDRWSRLDMLVVPAGGAITPYQTSLASVVTDEDLTTLINANMRTVVNCCRSAVPYLRASACASIVTVSSVAALTVMSKGHLAGYAMTKAAVLQYTRHLAEELGPDGIRVNCIAPGIIRTARVAAQAAATTADMQKIPLRRAGEPSDVADAMQYLVSPLASYVTGQVLAVNGGSTMH